MTNNPTVNPRLNRLGGTPSKALDKSLGYAWQDYNERPHEWRYSARSYMSAILRHNNILNNVTIDYLLNRTWLMVEENEWLGNRRMLMRCFGTVCRNYNREKQEAKQAKKEQTPLAEKLAWEKAVKHPELGSPRGYYETGFVPDIAGATKIMEAYEASQRQATTPPSVAPKADSELDQWFGKKEDKTMDTSETAALNERLNALAAQQSGDELTEPMWSAVTADKPAQQPMAFQHFRRELLAIDETADVTVHTVAALDMPLGLHLEKFGVGVTCEKLQKYLWKLAENKNAPEGQRFDDSGRDVPETASTPTAPPPASVENIEPKPTLQIIKGAEMSDSPDLGSVWTVVIINGHAMHITAKKGETPDDVANNVFTVLDGLKKVFADERCKSYGPVLDGRDKVTFMKGDAPQLESVATSSVTPPAQLDSGATDVYLIKVGKTFKKDKDQIQFECNGFDEPPKYSSKDVSALVRIVSGLRKSDGSAITAADLVEGAKLPVRGKVNWKRTDDGKYVNVLGTEAA